ncbi:MAG: class I SAM-dependent methyltransferase [Flavisolibacter sp.]|nr:class I SAM-dependent methyltransferase [Flavisolibacter sp.]
MSKVHYTACPVCFSKNIEPVLTAKDYTVSGEAFQIWQCTACTLRFTQDVPDEKEIGKYYKSEDYISHSDTRKGAINKLYQKVRNYTLQQKKKLIVQYTGLAKGNILDIGAGTGVFLYTMKRACWEVKGIEPDTDARQIALRSFQLELMTPDRLQDLCNDSFDAITLWHVLEHVHPLQQYMEAIKNLLRKNGNLFIAVPNYQSFDAASYQNYWAAYDVPRHLYHFTPQAMEVLLQQHGLKIIEKKPMWFDSFYISLLSSKYKNGRSSWLGAGWTGLRSNIKAWLHTDLCSSLIYIVKKY